MASSKNSPKRRKSIAVMNQNKPVAVQRAKRRPHSIVGGDHLSPFAKSRRLLAPRKSILKGSLNLPSVALNPDSDSQSQSSQSQSQGSVPNDATPSMDITRDFQTQVHDKTSRKSLGRRVSFAESATVRLFQIDRNNTNDTASLQSSPVSDDDLYRHANPQNDENSYPGSSAYKRRRSSVHSYASNDGEQSMEIDDTIVTPADFLQAPQGTGSAIDDYDNDDYGDDMDVTEAIAANIIRKHSLSIRGLSARPPFSVVHDETRPSIDLDQSQSFSEGPSYSEPQSMSQSDIDPNQSQPMEFTIPLNQSLRPPAHQDEAWMALYQATHSGSTPYEPPPSSDDEFNDLNRGSENDMDLDDAMERLTRARQSIAPAFDRSPRTYDQNAETDERFDQPQQQDPLRDDTFSSTEDSFNNDIYNGDATLNVSKLIGMPGLRERTNLVGQSAYIDSTMEGTEIYGGAIDTSHSEHSSMPQSQSQPGPTLTPAPSESIRPSIFQSRPSSLAFSPPEVFSTPKAQNHVPKASTLQATNPIPFSFSFTPKLLSPAPASASKSKSKQVPAPSSPVKSKAVPKFTAAFAPPVSQPSPRKPGNPSPKKRPRSPVEDISQDQDVDKQSHRKKGTTGVKWSAASTLSLDTSDAVTPVPKPKPLSSSRKAPFEQASMPNSSFRRPSGYLARRKSMGVGLSREVSSKNGSVGAVRTSPNKKAALGLGRASVGSGAPDAWMRFENEGLSIQVAVIGNGKGKEKELNTQECERETYKQAVAVPSPTRGSPSPASSRPSSPVPGPSVPPVVDLSRIMDTAGFGEEELDVDKVSDIDVDATEQWRKGVEGGFPEDEGPAISIDQFFSMTNIRFMDGLAAPRRSTMHSSQRPPRPRRSSSDGEVMDLPLADYVIAMTIDVPQLILYSHVLKDLNAWMEQSKTVFEQAEEEAAKVTPELFKEYIQADEDGQKELLHQLKLIKTNTRLKAKSEWYGWKLQWIEGLYETADKGFSDLEDDAKMFEQVIARTGEILPELEAEYKQVMAELAMEEAEVLEIENCDQEYLNELKVSITEQNVEVEALRAEVVELNAQCGWLQERLGEVESQKSEETAGIAEARRILNIQKNSTGAGVLRLKNELESLEDLHMFRVTKVNPKLFEYVYASQTRVSIPCHNFVPIVREVDIQRVAGFRTKFKDPYPHLSAFLLEAARQMILGYKKPTVCQIVLRLADYWSSCTQLRTQLRLLAIKCPLSIEIMPSGFKSRAVLLFPSAKAKAFVDFLFDAKTFPYWPLSLHNIGCEVEVAYGSVDRDVVYNAVTGRLSEASPGDSHGCLLDSCIEALDQYQ